MFGAISIVALLFVSLGASQSGAENWTRFRGNNGSGVSSQKGIPTTWSPGDYAWNIELPGVGHAGPIIWEDKLFVTSAVDEGAVRYLFCLDAATGIQHWSRMIGMNRSRKHNKNSWASSTPTTDGQRVYAAFADKEHYLLGAYDFNGNLVWRRNLGTFESQHGLGTSPIIFEEMVIIANDQDGPSSIMAFDRRTGRTIWSTIRSIKLTSYATPIVVRDNQKKPQLICASGAMGVTSLDPYSGRMNWLTGGFPSPSRTVSSPVFSDGLVFQTCGGGGKGNLMIAVNPSGQGNVAQTHVAYRRKSKLPYVPTPISYQNHIYLWGDNGVVYCVEAKTGKTIWTKRIGGNYTGAPICIDGKIYIVSESGEVIVIAASPNYQLYGRVQLGDRSHATPAVANGRLFLRTYHRLVCLEAQR